VPRSPADALASPSPSERGSRWPRTPRQPKTRALPKPPSQPTPHARAPIRSRSSPNLRTASTEISHNPLNYIIRTTTPYSESVRMRTGPAFAVPVATGANTVTPICNRDGEPGRKVNRQRGS